MLQEVLWITPPVVLSALPLQNTSMIIPKKMPKNCRIIDFNCGSEEAGLRGSIAFTREHKGEPILENTWNINIDSVADKDFFEVVIKDDWQFCRFDTDLEKCLRIPLTSSV